jgi:hypothetical protein
MGCLYVILHVFIIILYENDVLQNPAIFPMLASLSPEQSTLTGACGGQDWWDTLCTELGSTRRRSNTLQNWDSLYRLPSSSSSSSSSSVNYTALGCISHMLSTIANKA